MKVVLLTLWISTVLFQEVAPNTLVNLPSPRSSVHTEYEAKYEQRGKNGNESFSTVKGNQEIIHNNCGDNWNDFAEKCASLIKNLIASLANSVSSQPGDATKLHLHIKNSFKHIDNTHNCSCFNTTTGLGNLDLSSLFNNVSANSAPMITFKEPKASGGSDETKPCGGGEDKSASDDERKNLGSQHPHYLINGLHPVEGDEATNNSRRQVLDGTDDTNYDAVPAPVGTTGQLLHPNHLTSGDQNGQYPMPVSGASTPSEDFFVEVPEKSSPNAPDAVNPTLPGNLKIDKSEKSPNPSYFDKQPPTVPESENSVTSPFGKLDAPNLPHTDPNHPALPYPLPPGTSIEMSANSPNPPHFDREPPNAAEHVPLPSDMPGQPDFDQPNLAPYANSQGQDPVTPEADTPCDTPESDSVPAPLQPQQGGTPDSTLPEAPLPPHSAYPAIPPSPDLQSLSHGKLDSVSPAPSIPQPPVAPEGQPGSSLPFTPQPPVNPPHGIFPGPLRPGFLAPIPNIPPHLAPQLTSPPPLRPPVNPLPGFPFPPPGFGVPPVGTIPPTPGNFPVPPHPPTPPMFAPHSGITTPPTSESQTLGNSFGDSSPERGPAPPPRGMEPPSKGILPPPEGILPFSEGMAPPAGGVAPPSEGMAPPEGNVVPPPGVLPPTGGAAPPSESMAPLEGNVVPPPNVLPSAGGLPPPSDGMAPPGGNMVSPPGDVPPMGGIGTDSFNQHPPTSDASPDQPQVLPPMAHPPIAYPPMFTNTPGTGDHGFHQPSNHPAAPSDGTKEKFDSPTPEVLPPSVMPPRVLPPAPAPSYPRNSEQPETPEGDFATYPAPVEPALAPTPNHLGPDGLSGPLQPSFGVPESPAGGVGSDVTPPRLPNTIPDLPRPSYPSAGVTPEGAPSVPSNDVPAPGLSAPQPSFEGSPLTPEGSPVISSPVEGTSGVGTPFAPPALDALHPSATPQSDYVNDGRFSKTDLPQADRGDYPDWQVHTQQPPSYTTAIPPRPEVIKPMIPPSAGILDDDVDDDDDDTFPTERPTTFQTTSADPTSPQVNILLPPAYRPSTPSHSSPQFTTEGYSEPPPPRPTTGYHKSKDPYDDDDDDDEDCCSCESCTEDEPQNTKQFRTSACQDLEVARRELKAIFDKIRKKLKCGRKTIRPFVAPAIAR